jgi:hypothetical protein
MLKEEETLDVAFHFNWNFENRNFQILKVNIILSAGNLKGYIEGGDPCWYPSFFNNKNFENWKFQQKIMKKSSSSTFFHIKICVLWIPLVSILYSQVVKCRSHLLFGFEKTLLEVCFTWYRMQLSPLILANKHFFTALFGFLVPKLTQQGYSCFFNKKGLINFPLWNALCAF